MTFIEKMKMQAKQDIKTIVLPESEDLRTLEATEIVLKEGFACIFIFSINVMFIFPPIST